MKELKDFYDIRQNSNWRKDVYSIKSDFVEILFPKQKE